MPALRPRKPASLSNSVHRQLNMYALAATAAGVGLLSLAQPAEGKIVYTKAHRLMFKRNALVQLDLNHDGIADFMLGIIASAYPTDGGGLVAFSARGRSSNTVRTTSQHGWAAAYPPGISIGPKHHHFSSVSSPAVLEHGCGVSSTSACHSDGTFGNWLNVKNRYLGLVFVINGEIHYGWARLDAGLFPATSAVGGRLYGLLTGYAYETIPGKPIITGRTKEANDQDIEEPDPASLTTPTREPASLGLLALGTPGLSIWRREKSACAAPEGI
jgi:hypothetical protein